jgi:hypothetical protein
LRQTVSHFDGGRTLKNSCLLDARLRQGRVAEVIAAVERESNLGNLRGILGCTYARAGRRQDAERIAANASDPLGQARIFACLGDKERTIQALDRAIPQGPFRMGREVEFAVVRGDPRLNSIRKKIGLPY